ncbi:MAG: acetylxylan esterase [Kiritimatiellia bacterium]
MPLLFDMPFEQLQKYQGRNPKPADFDSFWDRSVAEMRAVDPQPEFRPAEFQTSFADCFDLFYTGVGGSRIHAKLWKPKGAKGKRPAILVFHGYSGNCGDWVSQLAYAAEGFVVAALDCRGQGGQSEDRTSIQGPTLRGHIIRGIDDAPEKMTFRNIYLDTAQLAKIVMALPEVDPDRVGCTGGSQGGGLTLACASLEPRIRRAAPVFPFLCDYRRVWEMDQAKDAYQELKDYFRLFDPRHEREEAIFTKLGYIDCQFLAPRIKAEVLMGVGFSDTICPPSTQFSAYNKITAKKSLVTYPDFGHEGLPGLPEIIFQFMRKL